MDRCLFTVHSLTQTRQHCLYDVYGRRDRDHHQNEYCSSALTEQRHAAPADKADRGYDDGNDHQDIRNCPPYRAQQNNGDEQHRPKRGGPKDAKLVVQRVAHGTIEGELASNTVVDGRILCPSLGGSVVEEVDNLYFGRLSILPIIGKCDTDNQPGHATVPGNEAPGNFLRIERDSLYSFYVTIAQGTGVVDKWLDNQLVL